MTEAFLGIVSFAVVGLIFWIGRGNNRTEVHETEGIEVFRGPATAAESALHVLCDGGIAAWLEECDQDSEVALHVEEDDLPSVRQVLQESGLIYA